MSSSQNFGTVYPTTPRRVLTPARVSRTLYSTSAGSVNSRDLAVLLTSGMAEAKIKIAIKHDAIGSKPDQPE